MDNWWHFRVVAHLARGEPIVSPAKGAESICARDPESAARKWHWRLTDEQRGRVDRLIVWGPPADCCATPRWTGPTIVYRPRAGQLVEIERR